jgi:hypothetical protein
MPDDLRNPGPEDGRLIALGEDHEVAYWCKEFGVTKTELMNAISHVGLSAKAVRAYFGEK